MRYDIQPPPATQTTITSLWEQPPAVLKTMITASDSLMINGLEQLCLGDFRPDLTLILDLPIEAGMARAAERGELDRFESEDIAFFQRVRQGFLDRAATADRYRVIDASQSLAQVQTQVRQIITSLPVYAGGTDGAR